MTRHRPTSPTVLFSLLLLLLSLSQSVTGQNLSLRVTPIPDIGVPLDLNARGAVVGRSTDGSNYLHWDKHNGATTVSPTSGYEVYGLNDSGEVIGSNDASFHYTGVICSIPDIGYQCEEYDNTATVAETFVWKPGDPTPPPADFASQEVGLFDRGVYGGPIRNPFGAAREESDKLLVGAIEFEVDQREYERYIQTNITTKLSNGSVVRSPYGFETPDEAYEHVRGFNNEHVLWDPVSYVANNAVLADKNGQVVWDIADVLVFNYPGLHPSQVRVDFLSRDFNVYGSLLNPATNQHVNFRLQPDNTVTELPRSVHGVNGLGWGYTFNGGMYFDGSTVIDVNSQLNAASSGWAIESIRDINDGRQFLAQGRLDGGELQTVLLEPDTQVIGLAWGEDIPREFYTFNDATGQTRTTYRGGSTTAATVSNAMRTDIRNRVQAMFDDSDVDNITLVDGLVPGATNVFFADQLAGSTLLGIAYSGIDQFNSRYNDEVAVFLKGDAETDAETVGHEVGHALGLRHVNPSAADDPDNRSLMDYDIVVGDSEYVVNGVSEITEPPDSAAASALTGVTHNPQYHLRHYVDGETQASLAMGDPANGVAPVLPGAWDLMPGEGGSASRFDVSLDFGDSDQTLYDVQVFSGFAGETGLILLENFDTITLEELEALSWELDLGLSLSLLASSTPGGMLDVMLATGDPFDPMAFGALVLGGSTQVLLQQVTDPTGGYVTLAAATLAPNRTIPEPTAVVVLVLAIAVGVSRRRFRRA